MTVGVAIVVAMVLYLIDRNKVWKQAAKVALVLVILAVLGGAGFYGWLRYDAWKTTRAEAKAAAEQYAIDQAYAKAHPQPEVLNSLPPGYTIESPQPATAPRPSRRWLKATDNVDLTTQEFGSLVCGHVAVNERVALLADNGSFVKVRTTDGKTGWAAGYQFEVSK